LIIKRKKKPRKIRLIAWVQVHEDFKEDLKHVFEFFKEKINITKKRRMHEYYRIESDNPAIMISLLSTLHELIPEIYFNNMDAMGSNNLQT